VGFSSEKEDGVPVLKFDGDEKEQVEHLPTDGYVPNGWMDGCRKSKGRTIPLTACGSGRAKMFCCGQLSEGGEWVTSHEGRGPRIGETT
jgi:hypothetical protein